MRGKTRIVSTDQPVAPCSTVTTDTARQETEGDHDDKRRRVDEPETSPSPVAQNEAPVLDPVSLDMETRKDEIDAEEWAMISLKVGSHKRHYSQSHLAHDEHGNARR